MDVVLNVGNRSRVVRSSTLESLVILFESMEHCSDKQLALNTATELESAAT